MSKPISPSEAAGLKAKVFPPEVIDAFNELIAERIVHGTASFKQSDVVALMVSKGLKKKDIFDSHWLDVEDMYREAGWVVEYDSPGYNESYPATFTFKAKK